MSLLEKPGSPQSTQGIWKLRWVTLLSFLVTGAILLGWDRIEHAYLSDASALVLHRVHMLRGISTGVVVSVGISWLLLRSRRLYEKRMLALQKQLIRNERMAAIGGLAGGVAHEIRNPLAGISGALTMLARQIPRDDDAQEVMAEIQRQIRRMEQLVEDLLSFARPSKLHLEWIHVHSILAQAVGSIRNLPGLPDADVVLDLDERVPEIHADPRELEHALENLILNAVQATTGGGKVEVRTRLVADRVHIFISDNGAGIEPDVMPRIFEPFFTTKARGTGLGLPLVRRAVDNNDGEITVRSSPGSGTIFQLTFPAASGQERSPEASSTSQSA
jgi:signal transduction histidine kinase